MDTNMAQSFTTPEEINTYVLVVLKSAINLYVKTGIKANRSYTPKNMLEKAGTFTGKTYKRGQLSKAAEDLQKLYEQILLERAQG